MRVLIPDASPTIFVEMTIATKQPVMQNLVWIKSLIAAYPKPVYSFEHEKKLWGLQFWLCINIWFQVPVPCNIMIQKRAFRHAKMQMHTQWLGKLVNIIVLDDTSIWLPKIFSWIFSGGTYSYGCAYPDNPESVFQTKFPDYYCEWRNGPESKDAICLCKTHGCNTAYLLDKWILNGHCGKTFTNQREKKIYS